MAVTDTSPGAAPSDAAPRGADRARRCGLRWVPAALFAAVTGAHFYRQGLVALAPLPVALLALFRVRRPWALRASQTFVVLGIAVWLRNLATLAAMRQEMGFGWARLAAILLGVVGLGVLALWWLDGLWAGQDVRTGTREQARGGRRVSEGAWIGPPVAAFLLTLTLLAFVQVMPRRPLLLPERFALGAGWWAVVGLALWAAVLTDLLGDRTRIPTWRARAWGIFSLVFFAQLALGLAGATRFLMTGVLHVPVPAVIIGGPLYRGGGFFMLTLFLVTVLLVGPAWCSWLCYIGAWDNSLARRRRRARYPTWRFLPRLRWITLVGTVAVALGLRAAGVSGWTAAGVGVGFGLLGVVVMLAGSRRTGSLVHCTAFCPLGLAAVVLGKISPFRLRIADHCTDCGACTGACRYGALPPAQVAQRRPGLSCTLCGDCLAACRHGALAFRFPGLGPEASRALLLVLVVSFHAVTLGVARV